MSQCKWCDREDEGNAGDYYHRSACHAKDVERRIQELKAKGSWLNIEMKRLENELERARYVGD